MLTTTKAIALRSVKYGESSLISTLFTRGNGIQSFMVQGVRSTRSKSNKAVLLQPASLLDIVVYQKPQGNLHRIRDMQFAYVYRRLQEDITRNSIALFSAELLLRLLPEQAPQPELFDMALDYFMQLDMLETTEIANFPLYFLSQCSQRLGYEIRGSYSEDTPFLNLHEGAFTADTPAIHPIVEKHAAASLSQLARAERLQDLGTIAMNAATRFQLIEWYVSFLQNHTQHMGNVRSLPVLQAVLH
jgi:DNA repair protein RecO (recombination protein O)